MSKWGRRFGCSPWWPRSGLVRPGPLVPTRRLGAVRKMACDGRFLAPYRITHCRRMSVTRWQKPSITNLQIGRIHTLQAPAPRIPRALQGCRHMLCDLPIRETSWISFTPCPRHGERGWERSLLTVCNMPSLIRVPTCRQLTLTPADRGVNFLICRDVSS